MNFLIVTYIPYIVKWQSLCELYIKNYDVTRYLNMWSLHVVLTSMPPHR